MVYLPICGIMSIKLLIARVSGTYGRFLRLEMVCLNARQEVEYIREFEEKEERRLLSNNFW